MSQTHSFDQLFQRYTYFLQVVLVFPLSWPVTMPLDIVQSVCLLQTLDFLHTLVPNIKYTNTNDCHSILNILIPSTNVNNNFSCFASEVKNHNANLHKCQLTENNLVNYSKHISDPDNIGLTILLLVMWELKSFIAFQTERLARQTNDLFTSVIVYKTITNGPNEMCEQLILLQVSGIDSPNGQNNRTWHFHIIVIHKGKQTPDEQMIWSSGGVDINGGLIEATSGGVDTLHQMDGLEHWLGDSNAYEDSRNDTSAWEDENTASTLRTWWCCWASSQRVRRCAGCLTWRPRSDRVGQQWPGQVPSTGLSVARLRCLWYCKQPVRWQS